MTDTLNHWDEVYHNKDHSKLSWHQDTSTISLRWILEYAKNNDSIIDVGSGVSVLVDNLIDSGYKNISLLEISPIAIKATKDRLGKLSSGVDFINENVLDLNQNKTYKVWHDRAVFHFLTNKKEQHKYLDIINMHISIGGYFILSTFSTEGPKECSGLDIVQYDKDKITDMLAKNYKLIRNIKESHPHPNGGVQNFNYFCLQKER